MSRTDNSIRNIKYAIIGQFFGLAVGFFARKVFVHILGAEYLGINGLFSNILRVLSLAELGIGTSIVYSMYKPLADKDSPKIKALMGLYKKAYIAIGAAIAVIGASITPFLNFLIKDMPEIPYIKIIYLLFVLNSSVSYFFSYKRSLIIADQKRFIATFYRYSFVFVLNVLQIIILLLTKSFILFLILQLLSTITENISLSIKADRLYPFLAEKAVDVIDKEEKQVIKRNVKAMFFHKVGGVAVNGTDNIILSKYIGIVSVGLYSNYLLIINALNTIIGLIFDSVTASVGNLGVTETKEKQRITFDMVNFAGFWIYSFASISLVVLLNPFITLWLGRNYTFPVWTMILIVAIFYFNGMRKSVLVFKNALGFYWQDRYKPAFEAGINLITSILLAKKIGTDGVFVGTVISILTTCFWIEPYIVYKHGFEFNVMHYFQKYGIYTFIMAITGFCTYKAAGVFSGTTTLNFIYKTIICLIVPNVTYILVFRTTKEFKDLFNIIKLNVFKIKV